jgi:uncharacterized membrane protein YfcA
MDLTTILLLGIAALLAGFIDAIAGGGGMLVMPALAEYRDAAASGGRHQQAGRHLRHLQRFGDFHPQGIVPAGAVVGDEFRHLRRSAVRRGADLSDERRRAEKIAAAGDPAGVGVSDLGHAGHRRSKRFREPVATPPGRRGVKLLTGGLIGFYDGFIGPGTGAFWMAAAMKLFHLDLVAAAGVARFMNFVSNLTALADLRGILGNIDYTVGLTMGATLMLGAFVGAHSAIRYGAPFIRPVFLLVVALMAGRLLLAA